MIRELSCIIAIFISLLLPSTPFAYAKDAEIFSAIEKGDLHQIQSYVGNSGNVNLVNSQGSTLLMWSVLYREYEITKYLLNSGANPDIVNKEKETLLHYYALGFIGRGRRKAPIGEEELAWPLNQINKLPFSASKNNLSPLHHVLINNYYSQQLPVPIYQVLIGKETDLNRIGTQNGFSYLSRAPHAITQQIIDAGADINYQDESGKTALMHALGQSSSYSSSKNIVKKLDVLLANNADVNIADKKGNTAILIAAKTGDGVIVKKLLDHGADAGSSNYMGESVLPLFIKSYVYRE